MPDGGDRRDDLGRVMMVAPLTRVRSTYGHLFDCRRHSRIAPLACENRRRLRGPHQPIRRAANCHSYSSARTRQLSSSRFRATSASGQVEETTASPRRATASHCRERKPYRNSTVRSPHSRSCAPISSASEWSSQQRRSASPGKWISSSARGRSKWYIGACGSSTPCARSLS